MDPVTVIGGLVTAIAAICGALATIARLLWVRLFADISRDNPHGGGFVTRLVESHLDVNDSIKESIVAEKAILLEMKTFTQQQLEQSDLIRRKVRQQAAAITQIVHAAQVVISANPDDTIRAKTLAHLQEAIDFLEGRKEAPRTSDSGVALGSRVER